MHHTHRSLPTESVGRAETWTLGNRTGQGIKLVTCITYCPISVSPIRRGAVGAEPPQIGCSCSDGVQSRQHGHPSGWEWAMLFWGPPRACPTPA